MKFLQLPIGAPFEFKGVQYTKAGPFSAVNKLTGKDQMMMRSASITPLGEAQAEEKAQPVELDPAVIHDAVEAYHRQCLDILPEQTPEATSALEAARQRLIERLTAGQ